MENEYKKQAERKKRLSLNEAIKLAEETAIRYGRYEDPAKTILHCPEVINRHRQLARWLKELRRYRRGRNTGYWHHSPEFGWFECSECGWEVYSEYDKTNYCPSCGLRLLDDTDGEEEE